MESSKVQQTPPVQQLCSDVCDEQCCLPSPHLSNKQKSATLPCNCIASYSLISNDADSNSPVGAFMKQNISILSVDSGIGTASEDEYADVFSDSEDEDLDIQSMVEDDSWWIDGSQIALKEVLNSSSCETVYR